MKRPSVEISVGIFVLIGILCIGYLTITLGNLPFLRGDAYYAVYARFQDASGLSEGVSVEMAGVKVGQVAEITLDTKRELAQVKLLVRKDLTLTDDTIAAVKTSGLIGDRYISLTPGGSPMTIEPGGYITETQSAIDIESLISKYVFGSAEKKGESQ